MTKNEILNLFPFYSRSSKDFQDRLAEAGSLVKLPEGAFFVCEGEKAPGVAMVGQGRLRVYKSSGNGREITLYDVRRGDLCLLNVLSMMTGISSPANAVVEEPVEAVLIPNETFRRWIGSESELRYHVFDILAGGVVDVMSLVEEIAFKKLDIRLAEYLCGHFFPGGGEVDELRVTHESIASQLGSAREVISRLLKEFERQGAVSLGRAKITLGDGTTLRALAAAD